MLAGASAQRAARMRRLQRGEAGAAGPGAQCAPQPPGEPSAAATAAVSDGGCAAEDGGVAAGADAAVGDGGAADGAASDDDNGDVAGAREQALAQQPSAFDGHGRHKRRRLFAGMPLNSPGAKVTGMHAAELARVPDRLSAAHATLHESQLCALRDPHTPSLPSSI